MIGRIQAKLLSGTPRSRGFLARPISSNWLSRCYATSDSKDDSQEMHRLYQEQMLELKEERDLLFGFTGDEVQAWTGASASSHTLDESLLADINEARQAAFSNKENDISEKAAPSSTAHISQGESPRAARLSHVSDDGNSVSMVNVGAKVATRRVAVAQSRVVFPSEVAALFRSDRYDARTRELSGPKGPIFQSAKIAGIMAAKKTSDLIPLCHPLPLDFIDIQIDLIDGSVAVITCECHVVHKTGVEMEALTGASIAALTIYDMTKALSHRIRIEDTVLLSKTGGKRDVSTTEEGESS